MHIDLIKIKTKPTASFIKQLQEATMTEMQDVLENGGILGYVNLIGPQKQRVFVVKTGNFYRSVINRSWVLSNDKENPKLLHSTIGKPILVKKFKDVESATEWLAMFKRIKEIALQTQIFT